MTNEEAANVLKIMASGIELKGYTETRISGFKEAYEMAIKVLEERPKGEWEDYSVNFYKCPECGYLLDKDCPCCQNKVILPNCGADLRGTTNEP